MYMKWTGWRYGLSAVRWRMIFAGNMRALFLAAYNEIYRLICTRFYRAVERETVSLDNDALADVRTLAKPMVRLLKVYTSGDTQVSNVNRYDENRVQVPGYAEQEVQFLYQYMPPTLTNPHPAFLIEPEDEGRYQCARQSPRPIIWRSPSLLRAHTWMHAEEKFSEANFYLPTGNGGGRRTFRRFGIMAVWMRGKRLCMWIG